jgi:hypothetical protein
MTFFPPNVDLGPYEEINFPTVGPGDAGAIHIEPLNGVKYLWDGVKWDVYQDKEDLLQYWVRNQPEQRLTPKDPDDEVRTAGYSMVWLDRAPHGI